MGVFFRRSMASLDAFGEASSCDSPPASTSPKVLGGGLGGTVGGGWGGWVFQLNPVFKDGSFSRWWFHHFFCLIFTPQIGEMIQFDELIFFRWVGSTTT